MGIWEPSQGGSDDWFTPAYVFDALGTRFDLDVAHPPQKTFVPCNAMITAGALEKPWQGFIWMNPPFGARNAIEPWLDRFFKHGNGIALTPDRTSAPWFRLAWRRAEIVLFTPKIRFIRPDGSEGGSPSNGTALFGVGEKARTALMRAARKNLGILAIPMC